MGRLALIGVIAAMVMATAARSAPATEALIAETQAALDRGDAQHAANLADDALKAGTLSVVERGRLCLYRGLAEELLGLHDPAMRDFTAALETSALPAEEREQALLQRGFLRDGLGHLDEATRDYSAVIALQGESMATALNNRANIYRRQKRFVDAQRDYQAALSAQGGKRQYSWYGLGQIAEARADTLAARRFYAQAVAADPGYALASERLQALGGPPEGAITDPQDRIVLHPPGTNALAKPALEVTKEADGTIVLRPPQNAAAAQALQIALKAPRREISNPISDAPPEHKRSVAEVALRPALDQPARMRHAPAPRQGGTEVQLGAWRSEGEASAGWEKARLRAGEALNGVSPHIVTADLPGRGRYFRLRVAVTAGQSQSAFCAGLSARGVACLPARD